MPAGPAASQPQTEARPFPHGGAGVTRMAKASERQIALWRRTARGCCSIDGRCIAAEVLKKPLNHGRILDAGDHPQLPAATSANLYVEPLPSQRGHMPPVMLKLRRSFTFCPPRSNVTAPAPLIEATLKENACGEPICGCPRRLKRIRSSA